jgi:twinkle protein
MNTFFPWDKIECKGAQRGAKKTLCPVCSHTRKKKTDPCLSVNFETGKAKCWNCDALSFREQAEVTVKPYTLPAQNWQNYTALSERMVKYCEGERKIRQSTLIDLGITEEMAYVPALGKEANCITFNYFEGDKVVNKKYRDGSKHFTQSKNGKAILYNVNAIIGAETCYIVEGEFDVLALHTHGIKNAVSVPNGANDHDDYWINSEAYLKDIKRFIIATDNDEKGIVLRERIAQRLGRYRCSYIEWTAKDANGSLIEGRIAEDIAAAKTFSISGTFTVSDMFDEMMGLYHHGLPKTIKPKHESFGKMRDIFSVMRGHLVTVTGIPSHGKSAFSEWHVLNLVHEYGMKASFFSPEHSPMSLHQSNFAQRAIGRNFWKQYEDIPRAQPEDLERYRQWADQKIYLTGAEKGETPTWEWLLQKFNEQMYAYGIDIFVIDAFNKVALPKGNKIDEIGAVLTQLTAFAQANDVIIFLVAHPTKMKRNEKTGLYEMPTLYDVSGSADFRNQTHDGYSIYRTFPDAAGESYTTFTNLKTKHSFQGDIGGAAEFEYHVPTGRYYARGTNPPLFDMTRPMSEQTLPPLQPSALQPNTNFYEPLNLQDEDDNPF